QRRYHLLGRQRAGDTKDTGLDRVVAMGVSNDDRHHRQGHDVDTPHPVAGTGKPHQLSMRTSALMLCRFEEHVFIARNPSQGYLIDVVAVRVWLPRLAREQPLGLRLPGPYVEAPHPTLESTRVPGRYSSAS